MSAVLDLPTIRRFTDDLRLDTARCGNNEGMECGTLEAKIRHFVSLYHRLRVTVDRWARLVFEGKIAVEPEVEKLLHGAVVSLLDEVKSVVKQGEEFDGPCYYLDGLPQLINCVHDLDYLAHHWRLPKLAVGPAPRVPLSDTAVAEGLKVVAGLPSLPADWQPSTPEQREYLRKQQEATKKRHG